ncbi:complement C3-like [Etheostoma cragini]|uniref:complement C3-like n=1 Tax=Etheostoma cragini TaxID=417921 RepID=UPI00155E14B6|nr:complement C3-like [Etheostoma cragini]
MNHPYNNTKLTSTSVTLTSSRNFQELAQITVSSSLIITLRKLKLLNFSTAVPLLERCRGSVGRPHALGDQADDSGENCSMENKDKLSTDQRTAVVCETTQTSRIDFVDKVRLDSITEDLTTDMFTVKVLEVIKEGGLDVGPLNKQRTFLSCPYCRWSIDLGTGKTYLIMGTSKDIHRDDQHQSFQYVFGETTWIEYWPPARSTVSNSGTHNDVFGPGGDGSSVPTLWVSAVVNLKKQKC